jgi:hypothetical protein
MGHEYYRKADILIWHDGPAEQRNFDYCVLVRINSANVPWVKCTHPWGGGTHPWGKQFEARGGPFRSLEEAVRFAKALVDFALDGCETQREETYAEAVQASRRAEEAIA